MIEFWTTLQMLALVFGFLGCGYVVGSAIECDMVPSTPAPECPVVMNYEDCGNISGCVTPNTRINGEVQISVNI